MVLVIYTQIQALEVLVDQEVLAEVVEVGVAQEELRFRVVLKEIMVVAHPVVLLPMEQVVEEELTQLDQQAQVLEEMGAMEQQIVLQDPP